MGAGGVCPNLCRVRGARLCTGRPTDGRENGRFDRSTLGRYKALYPMYGRLYRSLKDDFKAVAKLYSD